MKLMFLFVLVNLKHQFCQGSKTGDVRLVGGNSSSQGRVEVFYNQTWGTVCDDLWGLEDANVVCRYLKLQNATSAPFRAAFGPGSGVIWMDNVKCLGSESSLLECPHAGLGEHNCVHREDASVVCGYPTLSDFTITNVIGVITSPGYPKAMHRANYEWTFKPRIQRPVAALYFDEIDLTRPNRGKSELFVKDSRNITVLHIENKKRKENSGLIVKDLWKIGFYSSFTIKYGNGHGGRGMRLRYFIFSALENQQSCNPNWDVRVSAGVGAINVSWNTLSSDPNYKYFITFNKTGKYVKNFNMVTNVTSTRIRYLLTDTVYSIQLVGLYTSYVKYSCAKLIKTKQAKWRLRGGQRYNEGLIQVNYDDIWGTVCALGWDMRDARVACRTLGYPPATYAMYRTRQFRRAQTKPWLSRLRCNGNESSLMECRHKAWGNMHGVCHSYSAGLVCGHPNVTKFEITQSFGVITSPGYPQYMTQAHYEWTIRPPSARAGVVMYFEDINLRSYEVGVHNLTVIDADGKQLFFVKKQKKPRFSYLSWKSPLKVVLYSSYTTGPFIKRGFRMYYMMLSVHDQLSNVPIKPNWNTTANSTSPHSIRVTWSEFSEKDMAVIAYLITCNSTRRQNDISYSLANKTTSSIRIDNRIGYAHYRVQVFVYLKSGHGAIKMYRSTVHGLKTPEGVPTRAPSNITVTFKNDYVNIKWDPIPQEYVHGVLQGYNVFYQDYLRMSKKITITTTNNHVVLMGLYPAMYYFLQVAGITAKGQGSKRWIRFLTKCADVIEPDNRVGTIAIPRVASRYWVVNCELTLKPKDKGALLVVMVSVEDPTPWYYPCRKLYIALTNGNNRRRVNFCGQGQLISLVSYGSAKVHFHSSRSWPFRRVSPPNVTYFVFKNGLDEVSLYPDWKITVTHHNSSTINIQWAMLPKIEAIPATFIAVCISKADGTQVSGASTNSSGTSVQISNLKAYSDYSVQVLAFLGNVSDIDWETGILRSQMVVVRTLKKNWNPRLPSRHDISNSVKIILKGLDVLQWNQLYDFKFKKSVAHEVTIFCTKEKRCPTPASKRSRRSSPYIFVFTSEQVHLLPGYPQQMSYSIRNPNKFLADLIFYVRFPPDSGIKSNESLQQELLLYAVRASVSKIGKALNKTILSVSEHRMISTATPPKPQRSTKTSGGVIAGSVVAVILSIIIIAVIVILARKHCIAKKDDERPVIEMQPEEEYGHQDEQDEQPEVEQRQEIPEQRQHEEPREEPRTYENPAQESFEVEYPGTEVEI